MHFCFQVAEDKLCGECVPFYRGMETSNKPCGSGKDSVELPVGLGYPHLQAHAKGGQVLVIHHPRHN